jgi:hypothetical protein
MHSFRYNLLRQEFDGDPNKLSWMFSKDRLLNSELPECFLLFIHPESLKHITKLIIDVFGAGESGNSRTKSLWYVYWSHREESHGLTPIPPHIFRGVTFPLPPYFTLFYSIRLSILFASDSFRSKEVVLIGIHSSKWPDGEYIYGQKREASSFIFAWHKYKTHTCDGVTCLRSFCWRCRNHFLPQPSHTVSPLAIWSDRRYSVYNITRAIFLRLLLLALWQSVSSDIWRDRDQTTELLRHGSRKQTVPIIQVFERLDQAGFWTCSITAEQVQFGRSHSQFLNGQIRGSTRVGMFHGTYKYIGLSQRTVYHDTWKLTQT